MIDLALKREKHTSPPVLEPDLSFSTAACSERITRKKERSAGMNRAPHNVYFEIKEKSKKKNYF